MVQVIQQQSHHLIHRCTLWHCKPVSINAADRLSLLTFHIYHSHLMIFPTYPPRNEWCHTTYSNNNNNKTRSAKPPHFAEQDHLKQSQLSPPWLIDPLWPCPCPLLHQMCLRSAPLSSPQPWRQDIWLQAEGLGRMGNTPLWSQDYPKRRMGRNSAPFHFCWWRDEGSRGTGHSSSASSNCPGSPPLPPEQAWRRSNPKLHDPALGGHQRCPAARLWALQSRCERRYLIDQKSVAFHLRCRCQVAVASRLLGYELTALKLWGAGWLWRVMQQSQYSYRSINPIRHPARFDVQCLAQYANDVFCQRAHSIIIRVDHRFKPVCILHMRRTGVFVRPLGELLGHHLRMIKWQVQSEIVTLFQVAFSPFFEILGPEPLIAAIESTNVFALVNSRIDK